MACMQCANCYLFHLEVAAQIVCGPPAELLEADLQLHVPHLLLLLIVHSVPCADQDSV